VKEYIVKITDADRTWLRRPPALFAFLRGTVI